MLSPNPSPLSRAGSGQAGDPDLHQRRGAAHAVASAGPGSSGTPSGRGPPRSGPSGLCSWVPGGSRMTLPGRRSRPPAPRPAPPRLGITDAARAEREAAVLEVAREHARGEGPLLALRPGVRPSFMEMLGEGRLTDVDGWKDDWLSSNFGRAVHEIRTWVAAFSRPRCRRKLPGANAVLPAGPRLDRRLRPDDRSPWTSSPEYEAVTQERKDPNMAAQFVETETRGDVAWVYLNSFTKAMEAADRETVDVHEAHRRGPCTMPATTPASSSS